METIGQRIWRLRLGRGFSRQLLAMARVLHVSPEYIMDGGREEDMQYLELSRIYKELSDPERETLLKLAHALRPQANTKVA